MGGCTFCNKGARWWLGVWLGNMLLALGLTATVLAQGSVQMMDPCSRLAPMPVTLGGQLAQYVYRMACAEQRLVYGPGSDREARIEARQQAIVEVKQSLSHLNWSLLAGMLTPPESVPLQAFKDAFEVMQRLGDRTVAEMRAARTPEALATVRGSLATEGEVAFYHVEKALRELFHTIEIPESPADTASVAIAFPPPGTRWQTRITVSSGTAAGASASREWIALEPGIHRGQPAYRMSNGKRIRLFHTETGGWVGVVSQTGETLVAATPHNGVYLSPLWVGKSWMMPYDYEDVRRGKRMSNQIRRMKVTAYETVSVPAGTYQAFKLEGRSYATRLTVWYAPAINLEVKRISERLKSHYRGPGASMTVLTAYSSVD